MTNLGDLFFSAALWQYDKKKRMSAFDMFYDLVQCWQHLCQLIDSYLLFFGNTTSKLVNDLYFWQAFKQNLNDNTHPDKSYKIKTWANLFICHKPELTEQSRLVLKRHWISLYLLWQHIRFRWWNSDKSLLTSVFFYHCVLPSSLLSTQSLMPSST